MGVLPHMGVLPRPTLPRRPETSQNIKRVTVLPAQRIKFSLPCAGVDYTLCTDMLCVQRRTSVRHPESMSVAPQYSTNYNDSSMPKKYLQFVETSAKHRSNPPVKQQGSSHCVYLS